MSTYGFTETRKNFYNRAIVLKCFVQKLRCHLLMPPTTLGSQNTLCLIPKVQFYYIIIMKALKCKPSA